MPIQTDKKIIRFKEIDSTQDYAKGIAEKSPHGTIVISEKQTKGRGQFDRCWTSSKGGLYFSIILLDSYPLLRDMLYFYKLLNKI